MSTAEYADKADKLRKAAADGNLEAVQEMISSNLDDIIWWINDGNNRGTTALQLASMWGQLEVCRVLLGAGADKEKSSNVGYTPLMCAALKGQAGVVRDLIKLGCSTAAVDNDNWTALHHAASSGDVAVVRVLLEGKASRKAVNADGKTARQIAAADVRPPA